MQKNMMKIWAIIGGIGGLIAILALIVTIAQLRQDKMASDAQDITQSTQIAILHEQLFVLRQIATLQANSEGFGPTATHIAQQIQVFEGTAVALATQEANLPYALDVVIAADKPWINSGVFVNKDATVSIKRISGRWRTTTTTYWQDGFNCSTTPCEDCLSTNAPRQSLIARVGDGAIYCAGNSPFKSSQSGNLMMSFNDGLGAFPDNEGQITVRITVTRE